MLQGSLYGDSQLVRLHPEAVDPAQPSNFVEVMDVWINLGPIIDLAVVDLERQGQGQVVTCSGKGQDSSLRIVRNGIGMIEQAAAELAGQCFYSFGESRGCCLSSSAQWALWQPGCLLESGLSVLTEVAKHTRSAVAGSSGAGNSVKRMCKYKAAYPQPGIDLWF